MRHFSSKVLVGGWHSEAASSVIVLEPAGRRRKRKKLIMTPLFNSLLAVPSFLRDSFFFHLDVTKKFMLFAMIQKYS